MTAIHYHIKFLGTLIPQVISKITKIVTNARFILIVEKDSVFQKLLDDDVPNKLPRSFIMITVSNNLYVSS